MGKRDTTVFSGAAGRVLWEAASVRSLGTGLVLGFVLLVGNWVFVTAQVDSAATPFTQVILALALARFVLNGQYGEWTGTLFSSVGGPWTSVMLVAVRYLTLTLLWLLPLILLGLRPEQAALGTELLSRKMLALIVVYVLGSVLTPPLLLIASVSAADFTALFSRSHWKALLRGRMSDLLSVYAVYLGGLGMAVMLMVPLVLLGFLASWKLALALVVVAACYLLGLSVNLLGRLCGFYVLGDFGPESLGTKRESSPHSGPLPAEPPDEPTPGAGPAHAASVRVEPIQLSESSPGEPYEAPTSASGTTPATPAGLPALLDAPRRVKPIMTRFQTDPAGAILALEDLCSAFAPHPQVLAALCVCRHRDGSVPEAVALAVTTLPMCFERGHLQLAAQIFKQLRAEVDELSINREQLLVIGDTLQNKDDLAGAGAAYSTAIRRDSGETRAIKGLLHVADTYLNHKAKPAAAAKVYEYLLKHCSGSPLADYMREGLEECRRHLAQAPA